MIILLKSASSALLYAQPASHPPFVLLALAAIISELTSNALQLVWLLSMLIVPRSLAKVVLLDVKIAKITLFVQAAKLNTT